MKNKPLLGITVGIIGYGNVGSSVAKYLDEWGAAVFVFDIKPIKTKFRKFDLSDTAIKYKFDVLIPCASNNVLDKYIDLIKAKLIIEGGNCQMSDGLKKDLRVKGVKVIDDFIANAGGVIASHCELQGMSAKDAFQEIKKRMS